MIQLTIPIAPVAWERVKQSRHGHAFVPAKTRKFKANVAAFVRSIYRGPVLDQPLEVSAKFILKKPKRTRFSEPALRPGPG